MSKMWICAAQTAEADSSSEEIRETAVDGEDPGALSEPSYVPVA